MKRKSVLCLVGVIAVLLVAWPRRGATQDWFRTGTGLGVQKVKLALPDFAARNGPAQPLASVFNSVLWSDLDYSGVIEMVSKSFYPAPNTWPSVPAQLKPGDWSRPPASAAMVAFGNLSVAGTSLSVSAWLNDVTNPSAPPVIEKIYLGQATPEDARRLAHEFADDIIARLTGGVPGIAETQIAYVSNRSGAKEIWTMDYDGANAKQLTHLGTVSLTPRWSPDGSTIACTCYVPFGGVVSAQVCLYSLNLHRMMAFPRFHGTSGIPSWSPDGSKLAFMSSMGSGSLEIYSSDASGGHLHRLSYAEGVNTSPMWNPKTGQQIVFVSDRGGTPQLYLMNSDGSNVVKLELPDMGYVVDPAWSPNGQLLAFSWRRPEGNYDIYVMDIASRQLVELTRDAGRNERPSWAPDGRHLVFASTRSGSWQIWTMLADGSEARQLTTTGQNESPNWSKR
jgi:TolB protein